MNKPLRSKALAATVNRLARRFDGTASDSDEIALADSTIRVATSANVAEVVADLSERSGSVYVAMTNQEGVREAIRAVEGTRVGVMQPNGDIVRPAAP